MKPSSIIFLLAMLSILIGQSIGSAHASAPEHYQKFICYEEVGNFETRAVELYGERAYSNNYDMLYRKYGLVFWKQEGTCKLNTSTLKWKYRGDAAANPTGRCGTAWWGGYLDLWIEDKQIFEHVRIGGQPPLCPGGIIQSIRAFEFKDKHVVIYLKGFFAPPADDKRYYFDLPITNEQIVNQFPTCDDRAYQAHDFDSDACETEWEFELVPVSKWNASSDGQVHDYVISISRKEK